MHDEDHRVANDGGEGGEGSGIVDGEARLSVEATLGRERR